MDADETSIGEIVVVADNRPKKFDVFSEQFSNLVDGEDVGDSRHQAASEQVTPTGDQFQGSNSSRRLIF